MSELIRIRLDIAFDGTDWHGWQSGRSGLGVADRVEAALAACFGSAPGLVSSSRTDSGVHAMGLVAHFDVPSGECRVPVEKLAAVLNDTLPASIRVLASRRAKPGFHARFGAVSKEYRYQVWNAPVMNPLLNRSAWHVPRSLDLVAMQHAAAFLTGTRDFRAFTSRRDGTLGSTLRTVTRCTLRRRGPLITFAIEADGFLYKMCRGIVGTLVRAGSGLMDPEEVRALLDDPQRRTPGMNAPAHGLTLWKVSYAGGRTRPGRGGVGLG